MPDYRLKSGDIVFVEPADVESFLKNNEGATLAEAKAEVPKKTKDPVVVDQATESEEVTGSNLENGSLESQEIPPFVVNGEVATEEEFNNFKNSPTDLTLEEKKKLPYDIRQKLSRENNFTRERLDELYNSEDDWFAEDTGKAFKSALLSAKGSLARIPTFLNEMTYSAVANIAMSDEERSKFDALPDDVQQVIINNLGANPSMGDLANKGLEYYEEAREEAEAIQQTMTQWETGIGQDYANGNWGRATARTLSGAIGAIPSVAQAMVPYVGIASIALGAGAEASADAQRKGEDIGFKTMGYAATVGAAEGALEAITKGIAGRMFKSLSGVGKEVVKKKVTDVALNIAKEYGMEGLSESGTLLVTKAADYLILGDEKAFENSIGEFVDTFLVGGMMGMGMGSVGGSATLIGQIAQKKKITKDLKNTDYNSLTEAYKDTKTTKGLDVISLDPSAGKFLNAELKKEVQSGEMTIEESNNIKLNFADSQRAAITVSKTNISKKETAKSIDLLQEKNKLNEEIKAIDDKALTGEQSLRVEAIDAELKSVVEMGNKEAFVAKKKQAAEKITKQLGVTTENFTDDSAFQTRADELLGEGGKEKASASYGLAIEKDGKTVILINDKAALGDNVYTTDQHEVLHPLLKQTFANSPDASYAFGGALLKELSSDNVSAKNSIVTEKLNQYLEAGISSVDSMEEVMNFTSEALSDGSLEFNATALTKLTDIFRGILRKAGVNIKFNDGKDVLNFIRDYNKTFSKGKELNLGMLKGAKEGIKGSLTEQTREESIEKIEDKELKAKVEANKDIKESDAKQSKSDNAKNALEAVKLENLKKARAQGVIGTELPGMVRAQVFNQYSGLGSQKLQDFTDEVVERIYAAKENEKWDGRGSLYGFINGRINLRIKDVVKKEYSRDPLERLYFSGQDGNQFDALENAADVVIEDVKQVAEKPKYKNLLESKLLSSDVLRSISDKVLKTVRTLKSRMDAKVSLNKTITPIIAEIKKEMGKQADIDLKKAMGSKKGGELKSFLLKSKKAILENMTTTWLMGAMPGAIQKQVDGKFTSDWQGKKIDRETVNTNNAGKTSGAEIVRRLPNAAQNVSDEVFLGYILDAKGNPIRGRKESLAKALAEEVSFDIFTQQLQSEDSELSKAFEANQQRLGSERLDNLVANITKQAERGNVKFSKKIRTPKQVQAMGAAVRYLQKEGGFDFADMTAPEITNISEADLFLIKIAFDGDLVDTAKVDGFMKRFQSDPNISQEVKDQMKKATLVDKDLVAKDAAWLVANLPKDISDALGNVDIFGFHNSMLDVASSKVDKLLSALEGKQVKIPGATGKYYSDLQAAKAKQSSVNVSGIDPDILKNVALMNSSSGLMGKIGKILKSDLTANEKKALYVEKYLEQVNNANVANKIVGEYLAKYIVNAARDGKISQVTAAAILQAQTSIKDGFRGLTGLSYITFKDGEQGGLKGEHLADNASSMYKILELVFGEKSQQEINYKISAIFEFHDQWLENRQTLDEIDVYGKNNSYKSLRILLLGDARVNDVFTNDLQPARPALKVLEQTIRTAVEIGKKANFPPVQKEGTTYKPSMKLNKDFNDMLERSKGVTSEAEFSRVVAKRRGASKGKFKVWMPSSLNDFKGLTSYAFAGKGRQGDADQKFFKETLLDPYFKGIAEIELSRQTMKDDFVALNKMFEPVVKSLGTLIESGDYTNDQAIRVYLWTKAGFEIPGLSKRDQKKLLAHINNNPDLQAYADGALLVSKQSAWIKPGAFWDAQTILSDLGNMTEKVGRKNYISEFIENVDVIFSETNLNKVEALYGTRHRNALEDIIYRMKNGTNRPAGASKNQNIFNNWVNNSIGAIMFFNRRSALLQTLSTVNFLNWSDNNPAKAAAAFANQPQYWADFSTIFNSAKLKQRRSGLKSDINEAEIASAVKGSKNKATAALSWLLKKGFLPTQMADSFAIAAGGASFYRNRINTLMKKGMSKAEAEAKAFSDFSEISEETQQSGDPALISSDQASVVGRLFLAFQNTPIQLNRSIKKSAQDIYNRRRMPGQTQMQSDFSNISKIVYYGAIQNIIFTSLSNALFALLPGFDDDEPTEKELQELEETKIARMANGIADTTLKGGFGLPGAVLATLKNVIIEYNKQDKKGFKADHAYTIIQAINLAPPIGSKVGKIYSGIQGKTFNRGVIEKRGFGVSLDGKVNLSPKFSVWGKYIEGTTNLPLGRAVDEINAIVEAFDTRNTVMQRVALGLGWRTWDVEVENEENDLIEVIEKRKKKKEKKKGTKIKNKKVKNKNSFGKKKSF